MVDSNFYDNFGPFSLDEIATLAEAVIYYPETYTGVMNSNSLVEGVAPLDIANSSHISVLNNGKYLESYKKSRAGICIIEDKYKKLAPSSMTLLISDNPYKSYAKVAAAFHNNSVINGVIDLTANVSKTAIIGMNCQIDHNALINGDVKIGNNCKIGANTVIAKGVVIGDNCIIGSNVNISYSIIGSGVNIQSGVRIGEEGFGFASDKEGHYRVPQLGRVIIGNNVYIGTNSCVSRGSCGDTIIGESCMIDSLVQIAHNVELGFGVVIVSQVGIAGSTKVGDFALIGGQVGIAGHLEIGAYSQIAAKSGVIKNIKQGEVQGGYPSVPIKEWHRQTLTLKKILKNKKEE